MAQDFLLLSPRKHVKIQFNKRHVFCDFYRGNDLKPVMIFLPGNPGIPSFYAEFLAKINKELCWDIWSPSYVEFHFSVEELAEHLAMFADYLEENYPKGTKFVIAAHSLGSYLTVQILKKRPNFPVIKILSLFPSLQHMAKTPRGLVVSPITQGVPRFFLSLLGGFLSLLPRYLVKTIASLATGHPENIIDPLIMHLFSRSKTRSVLYLASWEMSQIKDLEVEIIQKFEHIWIMYFGIDDGWCPKHHVEDIKSRLQVESYLCADGLDHAFVTQDAGLPMAIKVIFWLKDL